MIAWRKWLLGAALLASIAAAVLVEDPESDLLARRPPRTANANQAKSASTAAEQPPAAPGSLGFTRAPYAVQAENLFAARSWRPPAPPPAKAAPPSAPPLPFQYVGKLEEGGQTLVFLSQQERTLTVRQGQTLDGVYRVDRITPESVVFVYLPLKQRQSLALGRFN